MTFRTPDGGALVLHVVDLVGISEDREEIATFASQHVRDVTKVTAALRLHRRADGRLYEYREPTAPDTTPIYDRLVRDRELLDRIRRAQARIEHHRGDTP
ncbi:hypothetical protein MT347_16575 [Microbacterium sp. VKM Ac-2923]|nr:hypothetical protein [Microbacterium sp. VKM Ac-2923]